MKIETAGAESATPPDIVPTALTSQQSQALSKARVDLGAITAAAQSAKTEADGTTYPGSQKQGATAAAGAGRKSALGTQPQGAAPPSGIVPTALASQQSQALSQARVDPGAIAAAVQGAMVRATPPPVQTRPGEKAPVAVASEANRGMTLAQAPAARATRVASSSNNSLLQDYLEGVARAATAPVPTVPPSPTAALIGTAGSLSLGPEDTLAVEERTGGQATEPDVVPPPGAVAPLSLQGARITNPAAHAARAPADASAVAAAGSLGITTPRVRNAPGNHVVLDGGETAPRTPGQVIVNRAHAAATAREWSETAALESSRAGDLGDEAGSLRSEAAARREGGAVASAAALEERARLLQGAADRHSRSASRAAGAEREWRRRADGLPGAGGGPEVDRDVAAGDLVREATAANTRLVPPRSRRTRRRKSGRHCVRPEGGAGWKSR